MPSIRSRDAYPGDETVVVEDSEPEREAQRMSREVNRKERFAPQEVLELSDSDSDNCFHYANAPVTARSKSVLKSPPTSRRLSLKKFAFQTPLPRGTSHSLPTANTRRVVPGSELTRAMIMRNQKRACLSAIGVSGKTLSKLGQCVCCEERWKVKKTVQEKLKHIEACARQHAYTPETVSILIKKELKMIAENLEQENTSSPKTHLEEVVQDALSKRKGRPNKKESTLQEFSSQTRIDASKRLRAILGSPVNLDVKQGESSFLMSTQTSHWSSTLQSPDNVTSVYIPGHPPSSPLMPFLPSRFLQVQGQVDLLSSPARSFHSCATSSNEPGLSRRPNNVQLKTCHVSPTTKNPPCVLTSPPPSIKVRTQRRKKRSTLSRKSQAIRSLKQWQNEFLARIQQDVDLYHRILRYEPIHFDVFHCLAPPLAFPGASRRHVVDFLDQHAINYLGYFAIEKRRRRRRKQNHSSKTQHTLNT